MLKNITVTDDELDSVSTPTPPTVTRSAAVLRPGECADVSGHGQVCNGPVATGLPVSQLLQSYPIRVVLVAEVQPFLPFLGTLTARGEAYGQRENVPQGPVAGVVTPDEAGDGSPESPLPPVLPAAGDKEPEPVYLTCVPGLAAQVIMESIESGGLGATKKPRVPLDAPVTAPAKCLNPPLAPEISL